MSLFGTLFRKDDAREAAMASIREKLAKTEVRNWYADRYQSLLIQRNILGLITLASLIGVLFSAFVVLYVSSNKTIEPFILEIEDKSGIVNVVRPQTIADFTANETLKQALAVQYVRARESYIPALLEYNYQVIRLMSGTGAYRQFAAYVNTNNPASPINRYGSRTMRTVGIKSIQFLEDRIAQVRFVVREQSSMGGGPGEEHKIAIVTFEWAPLAEFSFDERMINPLGFQVVNYRVDDEIVRK